MEGGFPIDLVLFGMVAVFLVLRLVSILGKRTGFERPAERVAPEATSGGTVTRLTPRVIDGVAEPVPPPARAVPDPTTPLGRTLVAMAGLDRNFQPARFLDGAEAAFRIIVTAFAAGDRQRLHPLLSADTYKAFEGAIAARETAGEVHRTEIRSIESATIEQAELVASFASITVRFVSDQVNVTLGADGNPVAGTDAVTEIIDLWTFERDLSQSDPAWRLAAARSA
jgi:predicted lipid-binding transport protein (Tim44 family)